MHARHWGRPVISSLLLRAGPILILSFALVRSSYHRHRSLGLCFTAFQIGCGGRDGRCVALRAAGTPTAAMEKLRERMARRRKADMGVAASDKAKVRLRERERDVVPDEQIEGYDVEPTVLRIAKYPHPALRRPNAEVTAFDEKLKTTVANLFNTMYSADDGIGLAAPQVGINARILVYNPLRDAGDPNRQGEVVFVNPQIVAHSDDSDEMVEACLSFPGMEGPVVRPTWVEVEAFDVDGKRFTRRLEGVEARIFQHEYDHLDGVLYVDRLQQEDRAILKRALDLLALEYSAAGGKQPAL